MSNEANTMHLDKATDIVSAFVSNNSVPMGELPGLIRTVHETINRLATGAVEAKEEPVVMEPAVPIRKSITPDFLICLEDGKRFKSLKRHLRTAYEMSPDDYRSKWRLPADYPMVAPNYARARSDLAKQSGLGQPRSKAIALPAATGAKRGRGRPKATQTEPVEAAE